MNQLILTKAMMLSLLLATSIGVIAKGESQRLHLSAKLRKTKA
jgi:hypothetical protein